MRLSGRGGTFIVEGDDCGVERGGTVVDSFATLFEGVGTWLGGNGICEVLCRVLEERRDEGG